MKKTPKKSKEELDKAKDEYLKSSPDVKDNPNHLEDFEAILGRAVKGKSNKELKKKS